MADQLRSVIKTTLAGNIAMTIAELIFELVKKLPDQAAREVLDFVGYMRDRSERAEWRDLMTAQSASLALLWDNYEDQVWDNA